MAAQISGSRRNGLAAALGGRRGAKRERCLYHGCFRGRVAQRPQALQLGGCPRAGAATHRESKRHEHSIPCGNCRLTNSVGKGMGGTYLREVQGGLEGAAALFTVFSLVLLSLNCFKSPVIFSGCHNYKSLRITPGTQSERYHLNVSGGGPHLFLVTSPAVALMS